MLLNPRKPAVKLCGSQAVRARSFLACFEKAQMEGLPFDGDHGTPPIAIFSTIHALEAALVIFMNPMVVLILAVCRWTQVVPAQVSPLKVFMVNLFRRPVAGHDQVDQPMCHVLFPADANIEIPVAAKNPGVTPSDPTRRAIDLPSQCASGRVVLEDGSDKLRRQVVARHALAWYRFVSHVIVPRSLWLGRGKALQAPLPPPQYAALAG